MTHCTAPTLHVKIISSRDRRGGGTLGPDRMPPGHRPVAPGGSTASYHPRDTPTPVAPTALARSRVGDRRHPPPHPPTIQPYKRPLSIYIYIIILRDLLPLGERVSTRWVNGCVNDGVPRAVRHRRGTPSLTQHSFLSTPTLHNKEKNKAHGQDRTGSYAGGPTHTSPMGAVLPPSSSGQSGCSLSMPYGTRNTGIAR